MLNYPYKVLAKLLANKMKFLLLQGIHNIQFRFIHNQSIQELDLNMLLSIDLAVAHNKSFILLILDLEKAYDRISWSFILETMK